MTNKEAIKILKNYHNGYFGYKIDDVHEAHDLAIKALEERPQSKWFDYVEDSLLKARHGKYVLYKDDYLLDNLAREIALLESVRRMRGGADND